jgi:hypothetical protein
MTQVTKFFSLAITTGFLGSRPHNPIVSEPKVYSRDLGDDQHGMAGLTPRSCPLHEACAHTHAHPPSSA